MSPNHRRRGGEEDGLQTVSERHCADPQEGRSTSVAVSGEGLSELLARVEAATGSDRGIDAAIWQHLLPREYRVARGRAAGLWPKGGDKVKLEREWAFYASLRFTASLDAALALVERVRPGWSWSVGSEESSALGLYFTGIIWSPDWKHDSGERIGKTPALALLAALLRSLLAETKAQALPDPTRDQQEGEGR